MDLIEISTNKNRHPWEVARKTIVHKWLRDNIKNESTKILDLGSGDAYLADSFTKKFTNSTAFCVDIGYTKELVDSIAKQFDNNKLHLYVSFDEVKVKEINFVTLLDVIEHVPNDVELLNQILRKPYINKNTTFVITVPAYQKLFSKHDVLLKHYRRYNLRTLKETIDECGLKPLNCGYMFSILVPPRILQLMVEKVFSKNENPANLGAWKGSKFISAIIKNILMIDYSVGKFFRLVGVNLPGLSCYMICKMK